MSVALEITLHQLAHGSEAFFGHGEGEHLLDNVVGEADRRVTKPGDGERDAFEANPEVVVDASDGRVTCGGFDGIFQTHIIETE